MRSIECILRSSQLVVYHHMSVINIKSVASLTTIRDRAYNLALDIQKANVEYSTIKQAADELSIVRREGASDIQFLHDFVGKTTQIASKIAADQEYESITQSLGINTGQAGQVAPQIQRRKITRLGKFFDKIEALVS